jgi:hypothetical protein
LIAIKKSAIATGHKKPGSLDSGFLFASPP